MPKRRKGPLIPLDKNFLEIGKRIAELRKKKGLTQTDLAHKIGITQSVISDYEVGRAHLNDEMIIRFSIALGCSADVLLGLKNYEFTNTGSSRKIIKRLKKIEKLSENDQKTLLKTIDNYLLGAGNK